MAQEGPKGPAPTQSRQGPEGPAPTQWRQEPNGSAPTQSRQGTAEPLGTVPNTLETLVKDWEHRDQWLWQKHEAFYLEYGRKAIALGQPMLAFDILREGRSYFPDSVWLAYFAALALARSGSTGHAVVIVHDLLSRLAQHDPLYAEVLSLAGRLAKDQWAKSPAGLRQQEFGATAAARYRQAYEGSGGDYYPGINAATMSVLTGQVDTGLAIARAVRDQCRTLNAAADQSDYWLLATLGEACLLLGDQAEAAHCYREAIQLAGDNDGDVASIRRQVQLLATCIPVHATVLEVLRAHRVAVFAGHMIDASERPTPRFPPELEEDVRAAILAALDQFDIGYGYAAAACGADILFLECLLERGAQAHVILPFRQEDFLVTSVAFAGATWVERFQHVLERATTVRYAIQEGYLGDDILFSYNTALINGAALLQTHYLGAEPIGLFVVDNASPTLAGGTREALETWQQAGRAAQIIDLAVLRAHRRTLPQPQRRTPVAPSPRAMPPAVDGVAVQLSRQIRAMLFADMVGFSKLTEESAPSFIVNFWGEVARIIDAGAIQPAFKNTWGDGLFLVFDDITVGADFALRLRDIIQRTDWAAVGLPADLNIRTSLHAGPVFPGFDPILKRQNFFGSHVNIAARIEPITPPGAVYVSEQFAALLMARDAADFACDYMGHLALAKGFRGLHRIYRLRRLHEFE